MVVVASFRVSKLDGQQQAGPGSLIQVIAQLCPLWMRPRLTSRRRLIAATRRLSCARFFSTPRYLTRRCPLVTIHAILVRRLVCVYRSRRVLSRSVW